MSFTSVRMMNADLRGARLANCTLQGCDATNVKASEAVIIKSSFHSKGGGSLMRAKLMGATLVEVDLEGANLYGADLSRALLIRCNLRGANLSSANLVGTRMIACDTMGADLTETST